MGSFHYSYSASCWEATSITDPWHVLRFRSNRDTLCKWPLWWVEILTVYFLAGDIQEVGGAKFVVMGIGCSPLIGTPINMPMGIVEGDPYDGITVTFYPPLTNGPPGKIYLGSMDVMYHCDCFSIPPIELSLGAYPGESDVLLYDSMLEQWVAAAGNSLGFSDATPAEQATFGMIKRMYR